MKLSKTEIRALAQEFKNKLEKTEQVISFPKWKSSLQGQEIQKLIKERDAKLAEVEKLRLELIKTGKFSDSYNKLYVGSYSLEGFYKEITKVKIQSLVDIENALVIACIDSKSVDELMKKLEVKFKTK